MREESSLFSLVACTHGRKDRHGRARQFFYRPPENIAANCAKANDREASGCHPSSRRSVKSSVFLSNLSPGLLER